MSLKTEISVASSSNLCSVLAVLLLVVPLGCADSSSGKATNAPCLTNSDCASLICHANICGARDPKDVGEPCTGDGECKSFNCRTPLCAAGTRPDGDKCLNYLECASGKCLNNLCVSLTANDGSVPGKDAGADAAPLKAPGDIKATAGNAQVSVSWTPAAGAMGYNLYWGTASGVTPTTGTKVLGVTSPYAHTGLTNGKTYYYIVTALSGSAESSASGEASATPYGGTGGGIPSGLSATAGSGQNTLSWSPVTGATGYNLYWGTASGVNKTTGTKLATVQSPYIHSGLTNGTPYYYVVTAYDAASESAESSEAYATPVIPSKYGSVTCSLSKGAYGLISLTNTSSGGGKIEVYVFTGDPKTTGKPITGLTVIAPTGGAVSGTLTGNATTGAYAGTTTSPLMAGTYTFNVTGGVAGAISAKVLTVPTCSLTSPTSGSTHKAGTNLTLKWTSSGSQRATYLLTDNKGTVQPVKALEPDPGGIIINGKDIPYASPLDIKVTAAWSAKATPNTGGIVFGAEGGTKIMLQ